MITRALMFASIILAALVGCGCSYSYSSETEKIGRGGVIPIPTGDFRLVGVTENSVTITHAQNDASSKLWTLTEGERFPIGGNVSVTLIESNKSGAWARFKIMRLNHVGPFVIPP